MKGTVSYNPQKDNGARRTRFNHHNTAVLLQSDSKRDIKKHFNDSCSCSKTQQPCETKAENTAYRSRYRQGGIDINKNNLFNELDSMDIENIL